MIEATGISYSIADTPILRDINLTIPSRGITALIGPNGAGKSTLLDLISRQLKPHSGRISVDNLDVATTDTNILALKMAVVAQRLGVASRIRIRDLISFGRWPHSHGRLTQTDRDKIAEAIDRFDLAPLQHRFLDEISGGQRQRAFIAMAYVQDTDWLLLDEPLNNLDLRYARGLMAELRDMAKSENKSIVVVLHDLNYAVSWADHIVALKDGEIAFEGAVQDVATDKNFSALYQTHVTVEAAEDSVFVRHHD